MNKKLVNLFWGVGLIAAGGLALAHTLGYVDDLAPAIWISVFAGISIISLFTYFSAGARHWGWLFPAGIFGGLALIIALAAIGVDNAAVASPLFVGIGLPFIVAYLQDRPRNWWALIPAGVMAFLAFMMLAVENFGGEWIGAGLFFFLSLAFLLVYLGRRTRLWAALVAYVMFILGFVPVLALTPRPELAGILVLFAIGLPFLFVYLTSPERWWAIIPAGILLTSGLLTAIIIGPGLPGPLYDSSIPNALALSGFAATFAVVWLRHGKSWAMFVALAAACLAAISLLAGSRVEAYWPFIIIAVGIFLLTRAIRPQTA
jgi:hypothetical protein